MDLVILCSVLFIVQCFLLWLDAIIEEGMGTFWDKMHKGFSEEIEAEKESNIPDASTEI